VPTGEAAATERTDSTAMITRSKLRVMTETPRMTTLDALLADAVASKPDGLGLRFRDTDVSYARFDEIAEQIAAGLLAIGLQRGDRVAMFMPNCLETAFVYFGCFKAGLMAVPLNHRDLAREAEYALRQSGSAAFIVHEELFERVRDLPYEELGLDRRYVVGAVGDATGWAPFGDLSAAVSDTSAVRTAVDPGDDAVMIYTSGTTGNPKGVVWTHGALARLAEVMAGLFDFDSSTVQALPTPITHIGGLSHCLTGVRAAATNVIVESADPALVLAAIDRYRVNGMLLLPTGLDELVEADEHDRHDLSSLRWVAAGGDKVPLEVHRRFEEILGWQVTEGIGMTECSHYASNPPFGEKRIGSVGRATGRREIRIVDHQGNDVPTGKTGQILLRSPAQMDRYWDNPTATAETLRDGWLHTGDLGRVDADGYLWFQGRSKELIIRAGSNIVPQEVEEILYQHPAVHLACVVGLPDQHLGARVEAYVSLVEGANPVPTGEDLRVFVGHRLASYKVPEHVIVLETMPRNHTGKVDRHRLEQQIVDDVAAVTSDRTS
jgi:long-chain acyl-CoA synthetase